MKDLLTEDCAHLADAVSDLLEALEHYIAAVPPRDTDQDEKWHKARAAIAKAKEIKSVRR